MKRFAFVVVAALSLVVGSACSGGGPSCKKALCSPACDATKQFCSAAFVCTDNKTCTPACKTDGTEYCDPTKGTCTTIKACTPACKTDGTEICDTVAGSCKAVKKCATACTGIQYCDLESLTCKDIPVCSPVCTVAGEVCSN